MILIHEELVRQRHQDLLAEAARQRLISRAGHGTRPDGRGPSGKGTPMRFWQERKAARALRMLGGRSRIDHLGGLEEVPLFRGLPRRQLAVVARRADPVSIPEGAVIATERHPQPQFMILTSGVAEATVEGRRIGILGPGDHFGELTLLEGEPQVPTVRALTDVEGFVLARREFWGVLHAVPALSLRLAARVAEDLRRAHRRIATEHADAC